MQACVNNDMPQKHRHPLLLQSTCESSFKDIRRKMLMKGYYVSFVYFTYLIVLTLFKNDLREFIKIYIYHIEFLKIENKDKDKMKTC